MDGLHSPPPPNSVPVPIHVTPADQIQFSKQAEMPLLCWLWLFWLLIEKNQFTKGQASIKACADKQRDHRAALPFFFFGVTMIISFCLTLLYLKEQGIRHHWWTWKDWGNRSWVGAAGIVSEGDRLQWEELSRLKLLPRGCMSLC